MSINEISLQNRFCIHKKNSIPSLRCVWVAFAIFNTLRPGQNGRHFPDDIFKCIFLNKSIWVSIGISLKFVPKGPINNIPALVQIMAWRRPGDKPLSEPMLLCLLTHICVDRPQCVSFGKIPGCTLYMYLTVIYNNKTTKIYYSAPSWAHFINMVSRWPQRE